MKNFKFFLFNVMLILPLVMFAQQTVKGKVTEATGGTPLPGVGVIIKGTTIGTATDFDGNYILDKVKPEDVLVFSYIGFNTQYITVGINTAINVVLTESAESLDEVVIIGYGTTTVKDATGSVEVVSEKEFNKGAIVSTDQLLTGKSAGVRITSNGGQPDAAPNIRIRGGSSLSANNNPLIVIDGIPIDNTNPAGVGNPLSLINPNDVESFSILKDASATAIYGSRASNGVIIITTKKGISDGVKFNFSTNTTYGVVGNQIKVMDGNNFTKFVREYHPSYTNLLGVDDPTSNLEDDPTTEQIEGRILSNTDWQDVIYRNTFSYDHNFSVRGSLFKMIPIRFSAGYTKAEGLVKTNDYERYTSSFKLTPTLFDNHLKVDLNFKGISSKKNAIDEGGALGGAINMDPTKPVYDENSLFGGFYQSLKGNELDGQWNPLALLLQRTRPEKVQKILANVELDYKMHFLPELRGVLNLGIESSEADIEEKYSENSIATYKLDNLNSTYIFNPGINYGENQNITNKTLEGYLAYEKELGGFITKFDVQGGYSYQNFENDGTKDEYKYNSETGLREIIVDPQNLTNRYFNELNLQSYFGRSNINLKDKYLFTASLRVDGSSLFNKDNRWGYFPAAAFAWKMYEEDFIKKIEFINTLKLRLGWGKTGQQDITGAVGFYPSIPLFESGSISSQYLEGVALYSAKPFNDKLTWEKTTTYNAGIDFDLFENDLLNGSFDVYYRKTNDLLAKVPIAPGQALTDSFVQNVGETESKGFELSLNLTPIKKDDLTFNVYSNISYNRSEVVGLKDVSRISADESTIPTGTGVKIAYHNVGNEPYSAWVFRQLYDTAGNPIHGAFADFNGDGVTDNDDRYYKPLRPNWNFGFGFNVNYKKFDLSSSFRGQLGGQVYNSRKLSEGWVDKAIPSNSNSLSNVLDFYNGESNLNFVNRNGNVPFSDYYLEDATFLRCENIVVGYNLNNVIKNTNFRIYGALNNPFIITKYEGQDPENFNAIDNNFYPRPKSYTLGLSIDF